MSKPNCAHVIAAVLCCWTLQLQLASLTVEGFNKTIQRSEPNANKTTTRITIHIGQPTPASPTQPPPSRSRLHPTQTITAHQQSESSDSEQQQVLVTTPASPTNDTSSSLMDELVTQFLRKNSNVVEANAQSYLAPSSGVLVSSAPQDIDDPNNANYADELDEQDSGDSRIEYDRLPVGTPGAHEPADDAHLSRLQQGRQPSNAGSSISNSAAQLIARALEEPGEAGGRWHQSRAPYAWPQEQPGVASAASSTLMRRDGAQSPQTRPSDSSSAPMAIEQRSDPAPQTSSQGATDEAATNSSSSSSSSSSKSSDEALSRRRQEPQIQPGARDPLVQKLGATVDQLIQLSPIPALKSHNPPSYHNNIEGLDLYQDHDFPGEPSMPGASLELSLGAQAATPSPQQPNSMGSDSLDILTGKIARPMMHSMMMTQHQGSSSSLEPEPEAQPSSTSHLLVSSSQAPVSQPAAPQLNRTGVAHYAASLINVTAPIVMPLSASEAMEADTSGRPLPLQPEPGDRKQFWQSPQQQPQPPLPYYVLSPPANIFNPNQTSSNNNNTIRAPQSEESDFSERSRPLSGSLSGTTARRPASHIAVPTRAPTAPGLQQASGFRSPGAHSSSGSYVSSYSPGRDSSGHAHTPLGVLPASYLAAASGSLAGVQMAPLQAGQDHSGSLESNASPRPLPPGSSGGSSTTSSYLVESTLSTSPSDLNGLATPISALTSQLQGQVSSASPSTTQLPPLGAQIGQSTAVGHPGRHFNQTRVEHISAECSNDLIRTIIIFNGTFKGIIYSSGYVRDPNCMYVNGTGKNRYEFSIRLNQCGTLGRQEVHPPQGPHELRRRDQVMWNTVSIQYNPIIEQEWDEHFRVSCEYGSDFWKTISFSPFNVETNTGSPVVFTVNPPSCQMEVRRGHNMMGPRQEPISGPVMVGDALSLLIHMKSERAGYDILVKNCIAHNGSNQKMQLIDSNGCVVNERFISPFRGTYNDNDLKQVTLYAYLKAFRFTGSRVLYLECEIHMCQSACPPQMCYWRRLSKRSANDTHASSPDQFEDFEREAYATSSQVSSEAPPTRRVGRLLATKPDADANWQLQTADAAPRQEPQASSAATPSRKPEDSVSLSSAIEVYQAQDMDELEARTPASGAPTQAAFTANQGAQGDLFCYRQAELLALALVGASMLLSALGVAGACCWRLRALRTKSAGLVGVARQRPAGGFCAPPDSSSISGSMHQCDMR